MALNFYSSLQCFYRFEIFLASGQRHNIAKKNATNKPKTKLKT